MRYRLIIIGDFSLILKWQALKYFLQKVYMFAVNKIAESKVCAREVFEILL